MVAGRHRERCEFAIPMNRRELLGALAAVFCGLVLPMPDRSIRIATMDEVLRYSARLSHADIMITVGKKDAFYAVFYRQELLTLPRTRRVRWNAVTS